jgi:hypothetical protein
MLEGLDMRLELLLAFPRSPFQVIVFERMDKDFRLIQPGRIGGCISRSPPPLTLGEISLCVARYVTRPAVLDKVDAS